MFVFHIKSQQKPGVIRQENKHKQFIAQMVHELRTVKTKIVLCLLFQYCDCTTRQHNIQR